MAWDQSANEYVDYAKTYYINLVLCNRMQHLQQEKQDLLARLNRFEKSQGTAG